MIVYIHPYEIDPPPFDDYYMEGTKLFAENLRRYMDGKELLNVIDKELRYQTSGPKYHDFLSLTDNSQG